MINQRNSLTLKDVVGIVAGLAALYIVTEPLPAELKWSLRAAGVLLLAVLKFLGK